MELKPGYKQSEVGVIPEEWEVSCLGDLAEFITSGSRGWARYYSDSGSLFIRSQNVREGMLDFSDRQYVRPPSGAEGERTGARIGDVLITITGNSVGNVAYLNHDLGNAYVSQHVGLVRLEDPKLADYICRYLSPCAPGNPQIEINQSGQSKPGLNLQNLKDFKLAIPTSSIERDAISNALSDIDSAIELLCSLITKKRGIKQAAMQELLTGKGRLPGFEGEWEVFSLGSVASMNSGGTPPTGRDNYYGGGIPWVSISDMTSGGKFISETERSLSEAGLTNCSARRFPAGTVLYAMYASLGECGIAAIEVTTSQAILGIRPGSSLHNEFLYYYLTWIHDRVKLMGQQGTQSNLNKRIVQGFTLKLPDRAEQTAIANVLDEIDQELDTIDLRLQKIRAMKSGMMQELLTGRIRLQ